MADTFVLTNLTGSVTYNFLTGAIYVHHTGWTVQSTGQGTWIETCFLAAVGTDSAIITAADTIDDLAHYATLFQKSRYIQQSVWLQQYGDTESAKRALVYDIEFLPVPRGRHTQLLGTGGTYYQIAITRGEWERTSTTTLGTQSNISSNGGAFTISDATVAGSRPARIGKTTFTGKSGSGPLDRVWIGIKPTRDGVTGFDPVWEAEDNYYSSADTSEVDKSGDSGTSMVCTFSTTSYAARVWISVEGVVGSDYEDMAGRYLAIARYQVTAADSLLYVGLMQGIGEYSHTAPIQYIEYTSGNWRYLPMGIVDIPGVSLRAQNLSGNMVRNFSLVFYAGKSAGTSSELWLDCIVLVPYEHFFYSEGSALQNAGTATTTILYTHEDMETAAISYDTSSQANKILQQQANKWWMPVDGGKAVVVAERTSSSVLADVVDVNMVWYTRFGTHRDV